MVKLYGEYEEGKLSREAIINIADLVCEFEQQMIMRLDHGLMTVEEYNAIMRGKHVPTELVACKTMPSGLKVTFT